MAIPSESAPPMNVYRNATYPVIGWLMVVACTGLFLGIGFEVRPRWAIVIWGLLMGIPAWLSYRFFVHARVESDQRGITVINAFQTHFATWSAIEKVSADMKLDIQLTNGHHLRAFAVEAANGARMLGRRSVADDVAESLNQQLVASRGEDWAEEQSKFAVSKVQKKALRTQALIFAGVILFGLLLRLLA